MFGLVLPWGYASFPLLGHDFANMLIGAIAFYLFLYESTLRQRRLMIIMQVFAYAFETANVSSGFYHYVFPTMPYYSAVPLWITLGWAIMGWWSVRAIDRFRRVPAWFSYSIAGAAMISVGFAFDYWMPSMVFAIFGIYLAERACRQIPVGLIVFATVFGILNEVFGPLSGVWSFTDAHGISHIPEFGLLSIGYAYVLVFCMWLAGYDRFEKEN
jgi:hypothetical protein